MIIVDQSNVHKIICAKNIGHGSWVPIECQIFYLFRCVLSSMLPRRDVGRSNFDRGLLKLIMLFRENDVKNTMSNIESTVDIHKKYYIYI